MTATLGTDPLTRSIQQMYAAVAARPGDAFHFEVGRGLAERLGYVPEVLDRVPPAALESFAGVGFALDLAALEPADTVLDLGCGSGTDVFYTAAVVGHGGRVIGVDFTAEQLAKAEAARRSRAIGNVEFLHARIEALPLDDESVDVVVSNGVINLVPAKSRVFAEIARVLKPGGRAAILDIVAKRPIADRTATNVALWAACIAGAAEIGCYRELIAGAGLLLRAERPNPSYAFRTERALRASETYGVRPVSFLAIKPERP